MGESVKFRQQAEKDIAMAFVRSAIEAGYTVGVDCDDEELCAPTRDAKEIEKNLMQCDDEHLFVYKDGKQIGWVWLIYGNEGWDVISDYTTNLEPLMDAPNKRSDFWEKRL